MVKREKSSGFTLIELLIVVAIIGLLVAISVVNYRNAIERARQRRSMADMRSIVTCVEAYQIDFNRYPPPAGFSLPADLQLPTTTIGHMAGYVEPTYAKRLPLADGWNSWFTVSTTALGADYAIRSNGRGGVAETAPLYGLTTAFNADIIVVDGVFVQYPDGVQR